MTLDEIHKEIYNMNELYISDELKRVLIALLNNLSRQPEQSGKDSV